MFPSFPRAFFDKLQSPRTWHAMALFEGVGRFFTGLQGWGVACCVSIAESRPMKFGRNTRIRFGFSSGSLCVATRRSWREARLALASDRGEAASDAWDDFSVLDLLEPLSAQTRFQEAPREASDIGIDQQRIHEPERSRCRPAAIVVDHEVVEQDAATRCQGRKRARQSLIHARRGAGRRPGPQAIRWSTRCPE